MATTASRRAPRTPPPHHGRPRAPPRAWPLPGSRGPRRCPPPTLHGRGRERRARPGTAGTPRAQRVARRYPGQRGGRRRGRRVRADHDQQLDAVLLSGGTPWDALEDVPVSGCRARWSPSATLAPRTPKSRARSRWSSATAALMASRPDPRLPGAAGTPPARGRGRRRRRGLRRHLPGSRATPASVSSASVAGTSPKPSRASCPAWVARRPAGHGSVTQRP